MPDNGSPGRRAGEGAASALRHLQQDGDRTAQAAVGPLRSQFTVLVIDDQDAKRYSILRTLEHAGYRVAEAATGHQGKLMAADANAVVLDILLTDTDGFEVCRALRAQPQTEALPILLVSDAFTSSSAELEGQRAGANAFLRGALAPDQLTRTVDRLLGIA